MLGVEFDARDHRRVHAAAAEHSHRRLERFDPAAVAHVAVLAGAHLGEQRLRPHLEVEAHEVDEFLALELLDLVVGNRARAERHRYAIAVLALHEARELQESLAFLAAVGERAADEIDVANGRLPHDRVQAFRHALERSLRDLYATGLLAEVRGAFVGRAIGAERAAHRLALVLVQEVLAPRRNVDHEHVAVRLQPRLRERQAAGGRLIHPWVEGLELDRHGLARTIVDEHVSLLAVALDVPRRVAAAEDADLRAVARIDEVGNGRKALARGIGLARLEPVGIEVRHRVRGGAPERVRVADALAHHLDLQRRRTRETGHRPTPLRTVFHGPS